MELGIYPKLTKKYILDRISQEDIMEKYLGIKVVFDILITAPPVIRINDNNPTCGFKYNINGKLRFRDFSGAFWGDCFDVVAHVLKIDSHNKRAFQLIIHTIAKDFKIHKYQNEVGIKEYTSLTNTFFKKRKYKPRTILKIIFRRLNYHDKSYWGRFNITEKLLNIGKVYFAQEVYLSYDGIDYKRIYIYNPKDPAYCYYGGKDIKGIAEWKIYYPFRKKGEIRFHSNSSFLQGKHLLKPARVCIVTKAYKDVLSFRSIGLEACAPSAESILLKKEEYVFLKSYYDFIVSSMDYDRAGMRMAQLLRKTYGIPPIMFTNGRYNSINYGAKDMAEYVDNTKDINKVRNLIHSVYSSYTDAFDQIDNINYNLLKHLK
jgi:hypothetical protein